MSKIYTDGEYEPGRDNIQFSGFDFHNPVFPFSALVAVLVSALVLAREPQKFGWRCAIN